MRSLNPARAAKKKLLVHALTIKLLDTKLKAYAQPWPANLAYLPALCTIEIWIKSIINTPAIVFRLDGRIDKRRYRRYVSKHRRSYKIKPNNNQGDAIDVASLETARIKIMQAPPGRL